MDVPSEFKGTHSVILLDKMRVVYKLQDASYILIRSVHYVLNKFRHCSYTVNFPPLK